jgi:hypothetical protein
MIAFLRGGSSVHPAIVLWAFAIVLDICLLALAVWRKRQTAMPYFFAFVMCLGIRDVALFGVYRLTAPSYKPYFVAYWVSDLLIVLLRFLVLREICFDVIREWPGGLESAGKAFKWSAIILGLVALVAGATVDGAGPSRMVAAIQVFRRSVLLFEAGLLLMLLLFAFYFGVTLKRFTFGVAFGLTVYAALQLPLAALGAAYGETVQNILAVLNAGAYVIALFVWIGFCAVPREQELDLTVPGFSTNEDTFGTHLQILELLRR